MENSDRLNNFAFLRILAAFLVIWGHSESLTGSSHSAFLGNSVSTLGVIIFFALSGTLVTQSWQSQPKFFPFLAKRSLRIFPALAACVLLTTFVLAPLLTSLTWSQYLTHPFTWEYLKNIILLPRYSLPAVFPENTYPHAVNGSLWSLPIEYVCYLLILISAFGQRKITVTAIAFVTSAVYLTWSWYTQSYGGPQIVIWGSDLGQATSIMPYFLVGAALYVILGRSGLSAITGICLLVALVLMEAYVPQVNFSPLAWLFLPYIVLSVGWARWPIIRTFDRFGDPSYGMYLYAFPIQQTIVLMNKNEIGAWELTLWTTVLATAAGYISWHALEKQVLKLKPR